MDVIDVGKKIGAKAYAMARLLMDSVIVQAAVPMNWNV